MTQFWANQTGDDWPLTHTKDNMVKDYLNLPRIQYINLLVGYSTGINLIVACIKYSPRQFPIYDVTVVYRWSKQHVIWSFVIFTKTH